MMKSMILFHGNRLPSRFRYNIELDSWDTFSESSLGTGKNTSALVDGILYCLDWRMAGFMFGLDISDPENKLQPVLGFEPFDKGDILHFDCFENRYIKTMPLPQPGFEDSAGPHGFLVSLGGSKLAVLWGARLAGPPRGPDDANFFVSNSVLNMSNRLNCITGNVDFVADTLSVSEYYMLGSCLVNCLPVPVDHAMKELDAATTNLSEIAGLQSSLHAHNPELQYIKFVEEKNNERKAELSSLIDDKKFQIIDLENQILVLRAEISYADQQLQAIAYQEENLEKRKRDLFLDIQAASERLKELSSEKSA